MKKAALQGHTLMASVHQPRAAIWSLFDSVSRGAAEGLRLRVCTRIWGFSGPDLCRSLGLGRVVLIWALVSR